MNKKIEEIRLYAELKRRSSADKLIGNINTVSNICENILAKVNNTFPHFTNHDIQHSFRVAEFMYDLLPLEISKYNDAEIALMLFSALTHDIGMASFQLDQICFDQIEDIRLNHHERSKDYINDEKLFNKILFDINGFDSRPDIINIDISHNKDISWIKKNIRQKKTFGSDQVNLWFICFILRLSDFIDFDRQRAPSFVYDLLKSEFHKNINYEKSVEEWEKQISIRDFNHIFRNTSSGKLLIEIRFEAETNNSKVTNLLFNFFESVEKEIAEIIANNIEDTKYFLPLRSQIIHQVVQNDVCVKPLKQYMDYLSISSLLMGENLYSDSRHALIELIQNSIDAVSVMSEIKQNHFLPSIEISIDNEHFYIKDNGIGMSLNVIEKYFLCVGKSFYKSQDYHFNYKPIGHFGIGFLSSFLLTDTVTIKTVDYKDSNKMIEIELNKNSNYVCISELENTDFIEGTTVILEKNKILEIFKSIENIIEYLDKNILTNKIDFSFNDGKSKKNIVTKIMNNSNNRFVSKLEICYDLLFDDYTYNSTDDFLNEASFIFNPNYEKKDLIDEEYYQDLLAEKEDPFENLLGEDDTISILTIGLLSSEQEDLLDMNREYFYEDDDILQVYDGQFDNFEEEVSIISNPDELNRKFQSYGHILYESGEDIFYDLSEDEILAIAKNIMYESRLYFCRVEEKNIFITGTTYLFFGKNINLYQESRIYLKNILIPGVSLKIPYLFPCIKIKNILVNILDDCEINVSRDKISNQDLDDLGYAIGKAIHLDVYKKKKIANKELSETELSLLNDFIDKYYSDNNRYCE
ncbi:MAG: ATP-binding protein [Treponemataceae bacterium]|nr:ATP-binding protein [Treponemataceae bacterium]